MTTTFSIMVENKFWVLAKISRVFSRHMFNIQSLTVAPTSEAGVSCVTLDVAENEARIQRMSLELQKITNVISVHICDDDHYVEMEMVLVKIHKSNPRFFDFLKEVDVFQGSIIFRKDDLEIISFTGDKEQVKKFLKIAEGFQVDSIFRTGTLAMSKSAS